MQLEKEPHLMRFYLRQCAFGFVLSAVFVAAILWADIGRLGTLVVGSDMGVLAVFLLWFFHGTIFGSVQFAYKVMSQAEDSSNDPPRGMLAPVRVVPQRRGRI